MPVGEEDQSSREGEPVPRPLTCRGCNLFFGDGDPFNHETGLCLECTKKDAAPCFGISYDGRDPACSRECSDASLCSGLTQSLTSPFEVDPENVTFGGEGPSYRSRSVHDMEPGTIGYEAYEVMKALTANAKRGGVYYAAILEEVQKRCPGKLQGKRPETTLYTILSSLTEVENIGGGVFRVVER